MTDGSASADLTELRSCIGREGLPSRARDPVNQPMIRHWCDAMTDHNPCYTDPEYAARSVHGEIVAPPTMLNAWTMPGNIPRPTRAGDPMSQILTLLDEAGFTSVVATNSEHEYLRYLRLGDHLSGTHVVTDVSPEKQTALGRGHFVTTTTDYRTDTDELVGRMTFRILKFKPGSGRASSRGRAAAPAAPIPEVPDRPPRSERTLIFEAVGVGDVLPESPVSITATLIVAGAIASRDYQDVHHDRDLAIRRGSPDIFMNILTTVGLCGRYISDWAGPEARLRRAAIRLGAPNYPHDTMTMSGSVQSKGEGSGDGAVQIVVRGRNRLGDHVTGIIDVDLPIGDPSG